ncbi:peptide ABC transporter substrate-binding protein [Aerophototrophica crusticola]|uniref:Peptide ABC transporter substrate-binding protein n=1 Tax=Aerophototrophica crusticola TaxID=1709002 RepID=A0A858R3Y2_9PROT|nr:peptide ABC transporter substrate-binding protein [Rhodospirillaceae bacterium B3]
MRLSPRLALIPVLAVMAAALAPPALAEKVLRRGIGSSPGTVDPNKAELHQESILIYDLFEGITAPDANGQPRPAMASRWEISPDGLTYTFHLRDGAKWSDGTPVTAADFAYSWRRLADPKTASPYAYYVWPILNGPEATAGKKPTSELGVEAVDAKTLKVTLGKPTSYFLASLVHQSMFPVQQKNVEGAQGNFTAAGVLVSNGAYKLAEAVPQSHYKLVRNDQYYDAKAVKIDTVMHYVTENLETELKRYRAGELDITYQIPITQVKWARENEPKAYTPTPTFSTQYMGANLNNEPWRSNPKLRAALSMAIDREVIAGKVLEGDMLPAWTFTPPIKGGAYQPPKPDWANLTQAQRDEMAKKLLAEAGYGPGGKPLPPVEVIHSTSENSRRVMIAVAAMWKQKLGLNVTLNNQEFRVVAQIANQKSYKDLLLYGWIGDFPDAVNFLKLLRSDVDQQNLSAYKNPAYDKLLDEANAATDPEKRLDLMRQAEALAQADFPVIPVYHNNRRRLVNPVVQGWVSNTMDQNPARWLDVVR